MTGAFRTRWLAGSEVINKYDSPSSSQRDKIARQQLNFCPFFFLGGGGRGYIDKTNFFGFCVVYTKTIIHLSVGESGGYSPLLLEIIVN